MTGYVKPEVLVSADWVLEHHQDEGGRIVEVDEDVLLAEFSHSVTRTGFLQVIHACWQRKKHPFRILGREKRCWCSSVTSTAQTSVL